MKLTLKNAVLSGLCALGLMATQVQASSAESHIEDFDFSFEGPFGTFDQNQIQRGLKVYTEVCAACHGLRQVAFRTLADDTGPGWPAASVKEYAKEFEVPDDGDDAEPGDMRPAKPADKFPISSDPNAPDLSLMAKARAGFHGPYGTGINQFYRGIGGPEYIASILNGYTGKEKEEAGVTLYENTAFPGGWISMVPPLEDEQVEFDDGHKNDLHHMSQDIATFLMWTAEPKLVARKQAGFVAVILLSLLAALLYLSNKKIWYHVKHRKTDSAD